MRSTCFSRGRHDAWEDALDLRVSSQGNRVPEMDDVVGHQEPIEPKALDHEFVGGYMPRGVWLEALIWMCERYQGFQFAGQQQGSSPTWSDNG